MSGFHKSSKLKSCWPWAQSQGSTKDSSRWTLSASSWTILFIFNCFYIRYHSWKCEMCLCRFKTSEGFEKMIWLMTPITAMWYKSTQNKMRKSVLFPIFYAKQFDYFIFHLAQVCSRFPSPWLRMKGWRAESAVCTFCSLNPLITHSASPFKP